MPLGRRSNEYPLGRRSGEHPLFSHPSATAEHPPLLPSEAARQPVQVFSPNESHEAPSVMVWTPDYFGAGVVHQVWGARCGGGSVMVWTPGSLGRTPCSRCGRCEETACLCSASARPRCASRPVGERRASACSSSFILHMASSLPPPPPPPPPPLASPLRSRCASRRVSAARRSWCGAQTQAQRPWRC